MTSLERSQDADLINIHEVGFYGKNCGPIMVRDVSTKIGHIRGPFRDVLCRLGCSCSKAFKLTWKEKFFIHLELTSCIRGHHRACLLKITYFGPSFHHILFCLFLLNSPPPSPSMYPSINMILLTRLVKSSNFVKNTKRIS